MKRTKEWWARLSAEERSKLVSIERSESSAYGAGGWIPDDCCECGACGTPHIGSGLCEACLSELLTLRAKAEGTITDERMPG